jgi:hypothetical protein
MHGSPGSGTHWPLLLQYLHAGQPSAMHTCCAIDSTGSAPGSTTPPALHAPTGNAPNTTSQLALRSARTQDAQFMPLLLVIKTYP